MAKPDATEKYCPECGKIIKRSAEICPKCGTRQTGGGGSSGKSRTTAALLALFLGGIGIHRFYIGDGRAWLYLVFFWTLVPAIIGLVDAIKFFMMSDAEFKHYVARFSK